jgi:integrase
MELLRLRVKDVDLARLQVIVRAGKGDKDRVTMLPESLGERLRAHRDRLRGLYEQVGAGAQEPVGRAGRLSRRGGPGLPGLSLPTSVQRAGLLRPVGTLGTPGVGRLRRSPGHRNGHQKRRAGFRAVPANRQTR